MHYLYSAARLRRFAGSLTASLAFLIATEGKAETCMARPAAHGNQSAGSMGESSLRVPASQHSELMGRGFVDVMCTSQAINIDLLRARLCDPASLKDAALKDAFEQASTNILGIAHAKLCAPRSLTLPGPERVDWKKAAGVQ